MMWKKRITVAMLAPITLGLAACGNAGEGPEFDASNEEVMVTSSMESVLWMEREKGAEAAEELDHGLGIYLDEGREDELDGMRATRVHEEVKEIAREDMEAEEQRRQERREEINERYEESQEQFDETMEGLMGD